MQKIPRFLQLVEKLVLKPVIRTAMQIRPIRSLDLIRSGGGDDIVLGSEGKDLLLVGRAGEDRLEHSEACRGCS